LRCLAADGRASFSEIAAVLGVSDQTVARRYRRLRGAGVIRVVGVRARRSMRSLGWLLHLRCVPGSAQPLAEGLARRTDTAWVQLLSGDTEVLCTVRGAAAERDAVLARLPRGGRIVAVSAHQLLGELDLALFRELGMDGRTSHADLAKAVGWSESTVRRQMDQLRESGALLYDLELDLPAFGFRAPTWLWLSVPPSELAATGAAFGEFLTTRVGSLRAVDRVETSPIIRTLKQSSTVLAAG
jgi:DNA-binding Lrp family transcriptional regulator